MTILRNQSWTRVPALFAVVAILSGTLMSRAAMAQEEQAVENFPTVLKRDISLWSDGTRLSGALLYPKDRAEGEKLPALVLCNGWGGTKAFLMRSGIALRFAAAGYVVIDYDVYGGEPLGRYRPPICSPATRPAVMGLTLPRTGSRRYNADQSIGTAWHQPQRTANAIESNKEEWEIE